MSCRHYMYSQQRVTAIGGEEGIVEFKLCLLKADEAKRIEIYGVHHARGLDHGMGPGDNCPVSDSGRWQECPWYSAI